MTLNFQTGVRRVRTPITRALGIAALVGVCLTCQAARVAAQPPATRPLSALSLHDAITLALHRNIDLLVARTTVDSANAERRIARSLPNPTFSGTPGLPYQYAVSLPIDVGPSRTYRVRAAALGVSAANLDASSARSQVVLAVQHAYYDVLLADAQHALAQGRRVALRSLYEADSVRARAGDIPESNLVRSEVEVARADADVAHSALASQDSRFALEALLGWTSFDATVQLTDSLHYEAQDLPSLDSLRELAIHQRADLQAALKRVAQADARTSLAKATLIPIPAVSYVRQLSEPFESGHLYSIGLSFDLPILNGFRGERERAAAGARAADYNESRIVAQVNRDVESARNSTVALAAIVSRYTHGLNDAVEGSVGAARYAYEHGATSQLDVIDALRAQREVQNDYLVAVHDYWIARYTLDAATGYPY
jgi:outer membrane protein TolC